MFKQIKILRIMAVTSLIFSQSTWADITVKAKSSLKGFKDPAIVGQIDFLQKDSSVIISGEMHGLKPSAVYAMHVHTFGDCIDPDAPGPHFDPKETKKHGHPEGHEMHHAGDLPNITADAQGNAKIAFTSNSFAILGAINIAGRSIVVHEKADDYTSQPAGASGARIACGIIGLAKPEITTPKVDSLASKILPSKK